jgi:hypothetical protein
MKLKHNKNFVWKSDAAGHWGLYPLQKINPLQKITLAL